MTKEAAAAGEAKASKGEKIALAVAAALYAGGLAAAIAQAGWSSVRWSRYPVLLPTGLLALALLNVRLRSKVLGWGIFSFGFVFFIAVLGACVLQLRVDAALQWMMFARAMAMYLAIAMAGLYQLRNRPVKAAERAEE